MEVKNPALTEYGVERIALSEEQQAVLDLVKHGQSIFFTGPAGTGKSVLLRAIIDYFRDSLGTKEFIRRVAITASTGIAALNIGGRTLHSWAGIGLGKEPQEVLLKGVNQRRWRETRILIIDEISMVDGSLFDKLEFIARHTRKRIFMPFGDLQLIISGDFFQLPPVPDKTHKRIAPVVFAFDANSWDSCIRRPVFLTQVFRQTDTTFIDILTNIRHGRIPDQDIERLRELSRPLYYEDGILPTELYPLRREVQECNQTRLASLVGDPVHYFAMDFAGCDVEKFPLTNSEAETLLERFIALPWVSLKVGAIVMLIMNINTEEGLVNGTRGIVTEFVTIPQAREHGLDVAESPSRPSREGSAPDPTSMLRPLGHRVFDRDMAWPLVRFENGRTLVCPPLEFNCKGPAGNIEAARTQIPLILAWALSVHKSQGQSLARVRVNLGHSFEKGQGCYIFHVERVGNLADAPLLVYVALSRATSMEGLQIDSFEPSKVMAHPQVIAWHKKWKDDDEHKYYNDSDS